MPFDQERRDYLNEKYPRSATPQDLEIEFRNNVIDRQVDELLQQAKNRRDFYNNRLMVPSDAELQYRSTSANALAEGLAKQPRPNPTPPTTLPRSTDIPSPGRQVSRAAPPPTPRTSGGAGNILDMTAPPPTAAPRQSMPGTNPTPGSKPSGLPGSPGRLTYPAAGAAIDFAFRVGSGQPIGQAAAGAIGTGIGSAVGFAAGSALGPMGGFLGGMIGGYLGGMAGSALYNAAFPPTAEAPKGQFDPKTGTPPFSGGQSIGVQYIVTCPLYYTYRDDGRTSMVTTTDVYCYGPVEGIRYYPATRSDINPPIYLLARDINGKLKEYGLYGDSFNSTYVSSSKITNIIRADGLPDTGGNPPPLPIAKDNRTPDSTRHPGNTSFAPPSATPQIINITNNSVSPAPNNYVPGGFSSRTGGTPRGDSPNWIPKANLASQPHPNYSPLPVASLPSISPSGSPVSTGAPSAGTSGDPRTSPFTFKPDGSLEIVTPGSPVTTGNPVTNPADRSFPGFQPTILTPNPLAPSNFSASPSLDTATPGALPTTVINQPVPDAYRPTPVVPAPTPTPTPTPAPNNQPDFDDLRERFNELSLLVTGLTVLLNPIANNTTPEALRDAAATGTCRTLQPGGCSTPMAQNAEDAARLSADNNNKLNALNTTLQGLDLSLLGVINNKLGPQLPGPNGIAGFLSRTAQAAKLDKALNALNTVLLLHNAAMLSRSLGSTLGDLTSQSLATIGIKDSEGSPIDINEQLGKQVNTFMESILGAEVWAGTKTSWNKASSIISSATNIMYTVRSMFDSGREILEWTAENTGKIGNALKKYRIVGEDAYKWMPERVTVQNRFTQKIDRIREGTDSLDDAASSLTGVLGEVQSIQQEYADLQEQKQRFDANIKDLTPKTREENKPVADAVTAARTASKAPADMPQVFRGEGETEDA